MCTTKSACKRLWSLDFTTNKIILLVKLNHQIDDKKKARVAAMGRKGKTSLKTKLRRIMLKIDMHTTTCSFSTTRLNALRKTIA
jgi:hypothetical protein